MFDAVLIVSSLLAVVTGFKVGLEKLEIGPAEFSNESKVTSGYSRPGARKKIPLICEEDGCSCREVIV